MSYYLPEQNLDLNVTPNRGPGRYSFWQWGNPTQLLEDMPLNKHVSGHGRHPHDYQLSRWFMGEEVAGLPMANPGMGTRLAYHRLKVTQYKGLSPVFWGDYGHHDRVTSTSLYSNYIYDGLVGNEALATDDVGHTHRRMGDLGAPSAYGAFGPYDYGSRGIAPTPLDDAGRSAIVGYDNVWGHNKVQEWHGITKVL